MSFNRVCHHILGYRGPTAIVVRDTAGFVFGFYTAEAWKESNGYYGSSECFLFRCAGGRDAVLLTFYWNEKRGHTYIHKSHTTGWSPPSWRPAPRSAAPPSTTCTST